MIVDAGTEFFYDQALSATDITSSTVDYGKGDAGDPPRLVLAVHNGSAGGKVTVKLQTADDEAFSSPKELGEYEGAPLAVALPYGCKRYLRLVVTSTYTSGTMDAALVADADIKW